MRRRDFLGALGSSAALMPFAARAVSSGGMPLIGILSFGGVEAQRPRNDAFLQRLKEMGWVDGRNVRVELRFGDGRRERADELAAEFARLKADVIVTAGVISILAAKRAMPATPIVFAITSDPVGTGVVDSLAHPGGTITGLSSQGADYGGKQVDLLREILPNLRRVGATANAGSPGALSEMRGFESAAKAAGLEFSKFAALRTSRPPSRRCAAGSTFSISFQIPSRRPIARKSSRLRGRRKSRLFMAAAIIQAKEA
jgi:putative ABC transport system substrate-binding protein